MHEPHRPAGGEFVLYWMQGVAMRTRSNPALDFAVEHANALGLPVLVYQGLRPDYPWASDRLHTFILESAADLAAGFAARGIQYVFHLVRQRSGRLGSASPSPLVELSRRAALVVTEYFPTFIVPRQTRGLRQRVDTPVVAIDASTVVPVRFHSRQYGSARSIRPVLERAMPHFLQALPNAEPRVRRRVDVGFEPTQVPATAAGIAALVAECAIDHSVPPSPSVRGGERSARTVLDRFLATGLPRYATHRSDPNAGANSRLSPHLHFGTIAIQDVLLEARAAGPAEPYARFLDEALVWRELSFNLTHWNRRHRTLAAVPEWARRELADHESDPRPALYRATELEAARTGSELWNAAQRALLRDGELHNHVRMLWGKAVLMWTRKAATALRILEHLNHKYALDGRDPCSYGGILWCFGRYDRPFFRRPIFGTVRYMSLDSQSRRFDVPAYLARYPAAPGECGPAAGQARSG